MNYDKIMEEIRTFCEDRDWRQFHNPKDLASALSIEASELQEIYLWKNPAEVDDVSKKKRDQIEQEIADIAIYLLDLVDVLDIDLEKVIQEKLEQNRKKYPVEDAKGKNLKYDEL
ncbi:MAG: nucleotide pyrophosphohydrolase [Opitutales bacterium]|nr:nucleotide pyrophosphohydrolase [Opitutales bacterium]